MTDQFAPLIDFHLSLRDIRTWAQRVALLRPPARLFEREPFGGGSRSFELLSRGLLPLQRMRVAASTSSPARTGSDRDHSRVASFRPRRFYGLDVFLRHPPLDRFPSRTLMGFILPFKAFPIREGAVVTDFTFPS